MSDGQKPPSLKRRFTAVHLFALAWASAALVGVWWWWSGSPQRSLTIGEVASAVAFSPDGLVLATGGYRYDQDRQQGEGTVSLWEVQTGRRIASWVAHHDFVVSLAFDPAGRAVTSTTYVQGENGRGEVTTWETKTWDLGTHAMIGEPRLVSPRKPFPAASPDGRRLALHAGGGTLILAEATGQERFRLAADPRQVNGAAFSPDGAMLATWGGDISGSGPSPIPGANGDLRLWDVHTGRLLARYNRHWWGPIRSVAFSPDGRLVASASLDGTVKLWQVPTPSHGASTSPNPPLSRATPAISRRNYSPPHATTPLTTFPCTSVSR